MKLTVAGLWHLGSVTAACMARAGHNVIGYDADVRVVEDLNRGVAPILEPGLSELVKEQLSEGRLHFTSSAQNAVRDTEVVWVAYDTPVDDDDNADVDHVLQAVRSLVPSMKTGALVLTSSQLPVGSSASLERWARENGRPDLAFAYSPENLRLGKAIEVFNNPDRIVVGVRTESDRDRILKLMAPLSDRFEWMSVESAEMTKHALNAFLATSVAFANEIATLCERVGADAREVERGLKSEKRIGPGAYLGPGAAFAGGTLARDVQFLSSTGRQVGVSTRLIDGVKESNDSHRAWPRAKLGELLGNLGGKVVAVWGLTYKPGTNTLRRSSAVELCSWLVQQGALVRVHDPVVTTLPDQLRETVLLAGTALEAANGADALVVMTEWPEYREIEAQSIVEVMSQQIVVDANRFLSARLGGDDRILYATVGKAVR